MKIRLKKGYGTALKNALSEDCAFLATTIIPIIGIIALIVISKDKADKIFSVLGIAFFWIGISHILGNALSKNYVSYVEKHTIIFKKK